MILSFRSFRHRQILNVSFKAGITPMPLQILQSGLASVKAGSGSIMSFGSDCTSSNSRGRLFDVHRHP